MKSQFTLVTHDRWKLSWWKRFGKKPDMETILFPYRHTGIGREAEVHERTEARPDAYCRLRTHVRRAAITNWREWTATDGRITDS